MFWLRLGILIGLLIWSVSVCAGEIDRATDSQGTIHIATPKAATSANKTDVKKPEAAPEKPVHLDYKSRPVSRRPMNLYDASGKPRSIRPNPYLNPPPEPTSGNVKP